MIFFPIIEKNIRMSTKQVSLVIFFKSDGTPAFDTLIYKYDPSSQQDVENTAITCASVVAKMENLGNANKCALGVRINAPPEFQPHLMAALNHLRTSTWNVNVRQSTATPPGQS